MVPSIGRSAVATCSKQRFRTVNEEQVQAAVKQQIPKGTQKSTNWGINVWHAWSSRQQRKHDCTKSKYPNSNQFSVMNVMHLNNAAGSSPTFVFNCDLLSVCTWLFGFVRQL